MASQFVALSLIPITEYPKCRTAKAGDQFACRRCGASIFETDGPGERQTVTVTSQKMSIGQIYLFFDGRFSRSRFWLETFLLFFISVPILLLDIWLGTGRLFFIWQIFLFWPTLAIQAKRWHDRNKSAWWILIEFIPIIGSIWALVELGFLKGTEGNNRFGAEP